VLGGSAGDDPWQRVGDGLGDRRIAEFQPVGQACDLAPDVPGRHGGDERGGSTQRVDTPFGVRQPAAPPV
jgi:hypothetical protein